MQPNDILKYWLVIYRTRF